ncbi:hypothetical protein H9Q72_008025 [Fusarium xylarioides]|uniref:Uncharacterized protein n=1 Tax=Fusarium xylarioides TaxID=221167 RepID=A0A9P7L453_9HYPO|nr:hypothetical protein H9Q72_008025 [Fusarium xylarioides]
MVLVRYGGLYLQRQSSTRRKSHFPTASQTDSSVIHHIKSHQAGTPAPPEEYERLEVDPVTRLYLHMSPEESISELWVRTYRETLYTLIVVTDYGRSLVVGPQTNIPGATYHAIAKLPQNKPSRMFYLEAFDEKIGWLHFDSVSTWQHPGQRQIQSTWGSVPEWPTQVFPMYPAYYTSARLDDVREITPCMARPSWYYGQGEKITGLLLSYANGSRSSVGEVRLDKLGTPKAATSDTMFIQYKGYDWSGVREPTSHLVDYGIEWFGFSEPLSPISSDETVDNADDETDDGSGAEDGSSEEGSISTFVERILSIAVPMSGRLDWTKTESTDDYTLSHHKHSTPKDEMRHVLAEHGAMATQEPVVRSLTTLIGNIGPENLEKVYRNAETNGNYDIFGL